MSSFGRTAGNLFFKATPAIGGYIDYQEGKAEGEDDVRAAAGAVGSTLGGWATTAAATKAGAAAGAAIGTAIAPVAGTTIGGAIGGLAGFGAGLVTQGLGSFAGGWAADRLDETVRGKNTGVKNNMSNVVQLDNGDIAEVDDNGNLIGWLVKGGAVVAGGNALYNAGKEVIADYGFNRISQPLPYSNSYATTQAVKQTLQNAPNTIRQGAANSRAGQMLAAMPGWAKVAGGVLLADQTLNGGRVTNTLLRPVLGGADAIANAAGFKTDFDGRNQVSQQAMREDREMNRTERNRDIFNPYDVAQEEILDRMLGKQEAYENRMFERNNANRRQWADKADEISRRNFLTSFTAGQANALLKGYMSDIPMAVTNELNGVVNSRYN